MTGRMHPRPPPLQLRPETPSTDFQSAPTRWVPASPSAGVQSARTHWWFPPSPIVRGSRALSGLAVRVFPGSQHLSSCCRSAHLLAVLEPSKHPPTCPLPLSPDSLGAHTQHLRAVPQGFKWAWALSPRFRCRTRCGWFLIREALKGQHVRLKGRVLKARAMFVAGGSRWFLWGEVTGPDTQSGLQDGPPSAQDAPCGKCGGVSGLELGAGGPRSPCSSPRSPAFLGAAQALQTRAGLAASGPGVDAAAVGPALRSFLLHLDRDPFCGH